MRKILLIWGSMVSLGLFFGLLWWCRDGAAHVAWNSRIFPGIAAVLVHNDAKLAMELGDYYFGRGAYKQYMARWMFRKAFQAEPCREGAYYQAARIAFVRGELDEALRLADQELACGEDRMRVHYLKGLIFGYQSSYEKAESEFARFNQWAPTEWAGYNDLAWIQIKRGKYKEAFQTASSGLRMVGGASENNPWLWTTLGSAYLNNGDYNESRETFFKVLSIMGSFDAERFAAAYPGNDPRGAENMLRHFLATIHFNLGVANEKLGFYRDAKEEYDFFLTTAPTIMSIPRREVEQKIKELDAKL